MTVHNNDGFDAPTTAFSTDAFDDSGFTTPDDLAGGEQETERPAESLHGGIDFGLFVVRLMLGGLMIAHGLQKFGLFDGPGIDGFAQMLTQLGFKDQTTVLAWVTAVSEVGGGALLVLGLFTPFGAAAVLGVLANAVYVKFENGFFAAAGGFEFDLLIAVVAFALLFTGAGRVSIDKNTPWRRKPWPLGLVSLVIAAGLTAALIVMFR
ncbi:DoxX family protein [Saccharomonospora sp. NB11]|jgi:putative oxidoreductase|uniref:DoxX family protein n=1 Tax=Saccharomonospora sp. NB11 TaxID=1642298 RepID=UPI0018D13C25|nr:DoxX family protein [Saccharomonospora sp. NB11]